MKVGSMSKDEVRPIEREASQQPLFFEKIMDFEDSPVWGFFFFHILKKSTTSRVLTAFKQTGLIRSYVIFMLLFK